MAEDTVDVNWRGYIHDQARAAEWVQSTFGREAFEDEKERAARVVEEAIELGQAVNLPKAVVDRISARVYSRPKGNILQEIAGTMHCLMTLAQRYKVRIDDLLKEELARVEALPKHHFRAKQQEKAASGTSIEVNYDDPELQAPIVEG